MEDRWSWRHPFADEPEGREVHWWVAPVLVLGVTFVLAFIAYWFAA